MKKYISLFLAAGIIIGCLCACSSTGAGSAQSAENADNPVSAAPAQNIEDAGSSENAGLSANQDGLQIVTTIFPEYDWVMNILGENPAGAEVTMLLDKGVDLHSFQPSAEDILEISTCDLFIYVGGEFDGWVADALQEAANKDMIVINLLEALGSSVKEEELVEGMQEEEHDHDHGEGEEHAEGEEHEHAEGEEHEHAEGEEHEHAEGGFVSADTSP